jgi:hypothetical protein
MKLILKCASHECNPADIEWALVNLNASLLERALARRRMFLQSQAEDDQLCEMYLWDNSPDFFALYPDPDADHPLDADESLEDTLRDHTGQPIDWLCDLHHISDDTTIPAPYMRAVECTLMRVDTHGIDWVCYPKDLDTEVRTSPIPWELIEDQRLFGPQRSSPSWHRLSLPHLPRAWAFFVRPFASRTRWGASSG